MLLGENGAGKSTLVTLLTGANRFNRGERFLKGRPCPDLSPLQARESGVNAVLQDFSLAPSLTVAENYALGRETTRRGFLAKSQMRADAKAAMEKLGISLPLDARVDLVTRAEQQLLEIVRALGGMPGALILDEPTATLSHDESERLFSAVESLKADGWAILYISHRMEEIRRLGDVVTILRDGHLTGFHRLCDVSNEQMIAEMVGREMASLYAKIPHAPGAVALETVGLSSGNKLKEASIAVRFGEIVGLGGLVGCGKTELARSVFGLQAIDGGQVLLEGSAIANPTPAAMLRRGLIYLPQDRRGEALALNRSVGENIVLEVLAQGEFAKAGFVRATPLGALVDDLMRRLNILPHQPQKKVQELSGGNQQKVVLGRALSRPRQIYIFDEPTAGIDVGARLDFYNELQRLCGEGAAILLVTSDLQELVHVSHRVYVMHEGACVAILDGEHINEDTVVAWAFGEKRKSEERQGGQLELTEARSEGRRMSFESANIAARLFQFGTLPIVLLICVIVFQIGNPRFLSSTNTINMLQQGMFLMLIAFGQMLVLLAGGFDLSVGSVVALTSIISAKVMVAVALLFPEASALPIAAGFVSMIVTGAIAGLINGLGVAVLKVNAFIVTLATASIFKGFTLVVSQGLEVERPAARFRLPDRFGLPLRNSGLCSDSGAGPRRHLSSRSSDALRPLHLCDRFEHQVRHRHWCEH